MQTFKQKTPRGRNTVKRTQKFNDTRIKLVTFSNRTWEYICEVIEKLKSRYKKVCRLESQKATGGGLFTGVIALA